MEQPEARKVNTEAAESLPQNGAACDNGQPSRRQVLKGDGVAGYVAPGLLLLSTSKKARAGTSNPAPPPAWP